MGGSLWVCVLSTVFIVLIIEACREERRASCDSRWPKPSSSSSPSPTFFLPSSSISLLGVSGPHASTQKKIQQKSKNIQQKGFAGGHPPNY
ncbi:hypothetical protein BO71DRAFT_390082 [Aspergillus ellipticus CBS 707.79]|uniref:Secreted protein n=1 Tax=Aspergillus ellipticus CBS 707.79 TaxID=1448320 RepID=A0A319DDV2_9EURO|nr:hypothetical protein BO71DRAFT_390082 [Aspergillus ellipticus CBS 707.79]